MKILGVSIMIFVSLTIFSIGVNVISGLDLNKSLTHIFNPLMVNDKSELVIFCILLFFFFAGPLMKSIQNRRKENNEK